MCKRRLSLPPLLLGSSWLKILLSQKDFIKYSFKLPLERPTIVGKYKGKEIIICPQIKRGITNGN